MSDDGNLCLYCIHSVRTNEWGTELFCEKNKCYMGMFAFIRCDDFEKEVEE